MIPNLAGGEFVYVRMQVFRPDSDGDGVLQLKLLMRSETAAFGAAWQVVKVPQSQIVCREPAAMYVDEHGNVRDIDASVLTDRVKPE